MNILNAKITRTNLGYEDHGILTFGLTLEIQGSLACCYGGVALDEYNKELERRVPTQKGFEAIASILKVVGVEKWEDLSGKYIRVMSDGWGSTIDKIGNLMEDNWFSVKEHFV